MATHTLKGPAGSQLFLEENHDLPLVRFQLALRVGAGDDAAAEDGLSNFATELMARGAAGKKRAQLDEAFDALGTSLDVMTDYDGITFDVSVLPEKLEPALALFADVILKPDFPKGEANKLKREINAQIDELRDDDGQLARRFFTRQLYGSHPYGRTVLGTAATLEAFGVDEARAWHERALVGGNIIFGASGDVHAPELEAMVQARFGGLRAGEAGVGARPVIGRRRGMRLTIVDKPERTQSQILMGQPAPRWHDPDFVSLQVATLAFGGTFTARLMEEVRSKRGLSYGASARVGQGRGPKALVTHVFPSLEQTPETLELVLGLWSAWVQKGLTPAEVDFAKGYLQKSFAFTVATPEDRLELRTGLELAGMPADSAATYVARVGKVTHEATTQVLLQRLTARDLEVVIVSTADELLPKLEAAGLTRDVTVEVVPYDQD